MTGRIQNVATGQYLSNARVAVRNSPLVAFTDETGTYRLPEVPGGPAVLEVFYTGLDPQSVSVEVPAGGQIERDVKLNSLERYGKNAEVIKLDPFVVANSKMTESAALAINEQRFAPNLKNIVATDAFGAISEGNVAEFMKFMPGISVEYEGDAPTTIQVRGLNASMTTVSVDGAQTANAVRVGASREFHFKQVSINDTSRIEVTKVPTPATPATSMGGSINLVSKSAFERDREQFNYSV
ncbi:MAG TPA: carboxypeptidase regulatory-like domain-containing protein, partial [Verrucomicrobiae bacterium]|nr:carboxypeptidase regulatory-like domain-containing protein [Verrucomicrobiae bacterium]